MLETIALRDSSYNLTFGVIDSFQIFRFYQNSNYLTKIFDRAANIFFSCLKKREKYFKISRLIATKWVERKVQNHFFCSFCLTKKFWSAPRISNIKFLNQFETANFLVKQFRN